MRRIALCLLLLPALAHAQPYEAEGEAPPIDAEELPDIALEDVPAYSTAVEDYFPETGGLFHEKDGIAYATGGVGEEERLALSLRASEYTLKVLYAATSGAYVGAYTLRVVDEKGGTVLEAPGDGPYFYVKLPPGRYTVQAHYADQAPQEARVTVRRTGQANVNFRWKGE